MDITWEVDANTTVVAHYGLFTKNSIKVNGRSVIDKFTLRKNRVYDFTLPGDRQASIKVSRPFVGRPDIALRVDDQLVSPLGKYPIKCRACQTTANSYDRFCTQCGKPMPTAEERANKGVVAEATKTISVLAGLFLLFGIVTHFMAQSKLAPALARLQSMDPDSIYPTPINGTSYKVAELMAELNWEIRGTLIVNVILAVVMVILAVWSRRAPLPAILVAMATYIVMLVASAIHDPATLFQGVIIKIIVIGYLLRGIKAAMVLRAANA